MLKITGLSLLLGAAALIAGLVLFYTPAASDSPVEPIVWSPETGQVLAGTASLVDGDTQLVLGPLGVGAVALPVASAGAELFPFLHIALETAARDPIVLLAWPNAQSKEPPHVYPVENKLIASQWIATAELGGWEGTIGTLNLVVMGPPGETVLIRDFSLHPASPWHHLQAIYSDLTAFKPWNRAAMNTHTGVTSVASFYPVPLAVALLLLSLIAYGVLIALSRGKVRFSRVTVALIFLANWMILDLVWQNRLWHQLADTYRTFAHVEPQVRQSVGPDKAFFDFATKIKPNLPADSRVIVASSDHYNGMRVAYYLFPLNVFWSLHDPEVPYDEFLRNGDYIALIKPSTFRFNKHTNVVFAPDRTDIPAELVYSDDTGTLVRMK